MLTPAHTLDDLRLWLLAHPTQTACHHHTLIDAAIAGAARTYDALAKGGGQ